MAKKKPTQKRDIRELSEAELEQVSGGAGATKNVLADAKHGLADAKRSFVDIVGGIKTSS